MCDIQVTVKCVCVIPEAKFGKHLQIQNVFVARVNEIIAKTGMAAACVPC